MSDPDSYAVFGNPVRHSKSPWIHKAFARQTDQKLTYRAVKVETGAFAEAAGAFFARGGRGLNVTLPFKQDAMAFAGGVSERARLAGAVNTLLRREDDSIFGDNTDGIGLVRDMVVNLGWSLRDKHIVVLGAGGAVRGVLELLLLEQPRSLLVVNRTPEKAEDLASRFAEIGPIETGGFDRLESRTCDLVINGTSASLSGVLPPLPDGLLHERSCCYDMVYGAQPTPFMRWAALHAAWAVADGLGMLVEQAAESFYIWRRVRPQTGPVLAELRSVMAEGG
jgi:shikimate dehydrogenase